MKEKNDWKREKKKTTQNNMHTEGEKRNTTASLMKERERDR